MKNTRDFKEKNIVKQDNLKLKQEIKIIMESIDCDNERLVSSIKEAKVQIDTLQEELYRLESSRFFKLWQKIKKII